eukprot:m.202104 g.202104  ORF g.202104 m.202104 type:complete len:126 (+) comp14976_c0_seq16:329-706(+)
MDISERIEKLPFDSDLVQAFERGSRLLTDSDWKTKLGQELMDDLRKRRTYRGERFVDLLRAIRNKKSHFQELSPSLKRQMGPVPSGFIAFFTDKFPGLLVHLYIAAQDSGLAQEPKFAKYFPSTN